MFVVIIAAGILSGCAAKTQEDNLILVEQEESEAEYNLTVVSRQDIVKSDKVRCAYQAVNAESLSFDVDGRTVGTVYVSRGDTVTRGQLIATLDAGDTQMRIDELNYQIERNEMLTAQLEADKAQEKEKAALDYSYSRQWKVDQDAYEERLAQIDEAYRYQLEDYADSLIILQKRLEDAQSGVGQGNLYAGMSGTISYLADNLEGSTTVKDERVVTILDISECIFVADEATYADYFTEGQTAEMDITAGDYAGTYEVTAYHPEETDKGLRFAFVNEEDAALNINVGARGTITLLLDSREDVLTISREALHTNETGYYVYLLDDEDHMQTVWVEIGLVGDEYAEVLSGLSEGDRVIVQ